MIGILVIVTQHCVLSNEKTAVVRGAVVRGMCIRAEATPGLTLRRAHRSTLTVRLKPSELLEQRHYRLSGSDNGNVFL